jgi:dienelactone hydrolase
MPEIRTDVRNAILAAAVGMAGVLGPWSGVVAWGQASQGPGAAVSVKTAAWLPPGLPAPPESGPALCRGGYLTPEQGKAVLDYTLQKCPTRLAWEAHAEHLRRCILRGAGLDPLPRRGPLHPIVRGRRTYDGYTVENVAFESVPGYFVTGNLYRPLKAKPPYALVLSTHGHGSQDPDKAPRFHEGMQARCGTLARMGAVVFSIDMFGFGESLGQVPAKAHATPLAMTMQFWGAMRAIDFLTSLDGADPKRIGVSGESGGGTQTFFLTALDPRVSVSVPVVMVSSYFFGGCPCESGRPVHRSAEHFATNAEIAALAAPRPMLVVSDGKDWTKSVPQVEYPFLREIYALFGAENKVANEHLAKEGHDYGPSKRMLMYRFLAERLKLDPAAVQDTEGHIDESKVTIEQPGQMRAFTAADPLPAGALHGASAVEAALRKLQE